MKINSIDDAVFEGIRKTISRFRRKPFHYFTEADIHSSLLNDITGAAPRITKFRYENKLKHISISLVHQEYPTHFRYKKDSLLDGYKTESDVAKTSLDKKKKEVKTYGDRGNFDLAVLNKNFVIKMLKSANSNLTNALKEIINKENKRAVQRLSNDQKSFKQEILYTIEIKFIHPFNARNINMLYEVIKDDQKLRLAYLNSDKHIRPINIVFCSSPALKRKDKLKPVIDIIKEYIQGGTVLNHKDENISYSQPKEVATIFIESSILDQKGKDPNKISPSPISRSSNIEWINNLQKTIGIKT